MIRGAILRKKMLALLFYIIIFFIFIILQILHTGYTGMVTETEADRRGLEAYHGWQEYALDNWWKDGEAFVQQWDTLKKNIDVQNYVLELSWDGPLAFHIPVPKIRVAFYNTHWNRWIIPILSRPHLHLHNCVWNCFSLSSYHVSRQTD